MSRRLVFFIALALAAILVACAQGVSTPTPPEIRFGEDVCADCNMIISDPRFASAYAYEIETGRFESLAFDDIGDMLNHAQQHPENKVVNWWVHDYYSEEWTDATTAFYVASENIQTPMGHGMAALAQQADAEKLAQETSGEVLDWDKARVHMAMAGHMH
jgi:copper chaperone NosL